MHAAQRGKPTPVEPTCRSGRRTNGRSRSTKRSRAQCPLAAIRGRHLTKCRSRIRAAVLGSSITPPAFALVPKRTSSITYASFMRQVQS
jgi:hypothetical protein